MNRPGRIIVAGLYFAVMSAAGTASTSLAVWMSTGGHGPLNVADIYIFIVEWPMALLYGTNFDVFSMQSLLVNMAGWTLVGVVVGFWLTQSSQKVSK